MARNPLTSHRVASRKRHQAKKRPPSVRLAVEVLEDRTVPSFFPSTTNGIAVFEDQQPSLDNALTQFMATHTDGTQKQTLSQIDAFRAFNPNYTMLEYQLGTGNSSYSFILNDQWASDWNYVNSQEAFFAHQTYSGEPQSASDLASGRVSNSSGWEQADIANPAWQQYTINSVLQNIAATGANGWFADSFIFGFGGAGYSGTIPVRFQGTNAINPADWPNGITWDQQLGNWVNTIESAFASYNASNGTDLKFIPNLDNLTTSWMPTAWYQNVDGAFLENFGDVGAGYDDPSASDWVLEMNRGLALSGANKIVIMQPYLDDSNPDSAAAIQQREYLLGTYLLLQGGYTYLNISERGVEPYYFPEYQLNLGTATTALPTDVSSYLWNGVYRRDFQNGFVLVNPNNSSFTLNLGGTYQLATPSGGGVLTDADLNASGNYIGGSLSYQNMSSITLGPGSAAIFLNPSGSTVSGSNSTASLATSSVASGSTDTVTLAVKDTTGAVVTGLASSAFQLTLSGGTSAGTFGSVTETSTKGTYTATFTGTTAGTASTLTAVVNGVTLTSQPTVTVTVGPVSGSTSTASFASPTVASGSTDVLTLVVEDAAGNAVTGLSGSAFALSLAGGTSTGTFSAVTATATKGTYTVTFTATTAGTADTLTATVSSVVLTTKPTIQVRAGGVNGTNSTVSFANASVASGSGDVLTIKVEDGAGNAITGLSGSAFGLSLAGGTSAGTFSPVIETATKGTYTATFTGTTAGTASTLTVAVSGVTIAQKPTITVTVGPVSPSVSTVSFASSTVASGGSDVLTIVVKDAAGNAVTGLSNSAFGLSLAGGTSTGSFGAVTEMATKGTYTTTFTAATAGTADTLTTTVNSVTLTAKPTVQVLVGGINGANSTVSFANASVAAGNGDVVTIKVQDGGGNAVSGLSSNSFTLSLSGGTSGGAFSAVTETATKGTYTATFTGGTAGTASTLTLTVTVSGVTIAQKPTVTVTVGSGSPSNSTVSFASASVASGSTDVVTLVLKDAGGNTVSGLSGSAFTFSLAGGTSAGTFGAVTETATKGTYTATFTATTAGSVSTLSTTVNGVSLNSKPTITVNAGAVSGSTSTVSFASATVTAGGSDVLTVTVKDAAGNPISGLSSSAFTFSLTGGTSAGTFGPVTETSTKGTYTATFTATTAGTPAALKVTINNVALAGAPTVTVTANTKANQPPTVNPVSPETVGDGNTLTVTVTATSPSGSALTYSLAPGTLPGVSIDAQTGVVTLSPSEWTGTAPGVYTVTVDVASASNPQLVSTTSFTVTVGPSSTNQGSGATAQDNINMRTAAAAGIDNSQEYYTDLLDKDYLKYVNRLPTQAELTSFWYPNLPIPGQASDGADFTDQEIEAYFIGSPEYIQENGGTDSLWIAGMYVSILGRPAAPSEITSWLNQKQAYLNSGLSVGDADIAVAKGIVASNASESILVGADYTQYLGRSGSSTEIAYWVNRFLTGYTNEQVIAGFVGSQEFFQDHGSNIVDWLFADYKATLNRLPDQNGFNYWENQLQ
jgi:Hypothetical glycosyl hydrolase family 15/Invasin, domain 3